MQHLNFSGGLFCVRNCYLSDQSRRKRKSCAPRVPRSNSRSNCSHFTWRDKRKLINCTVFTTNEYTHFFLSIHYTLAQQRSLSLLEFVSMCCLSCKRSQTQEINYFSSKIFHEVSCVSFKIICFQELIVVWEEILTSR